MEHNDLLPIDCATVTSEYDNYYTMGGQSGVDVAETNTQMINGSFSKKARRKKNNGKNSANNKKRKKGTHPEDWKTTKRKKLRNSGQPYVTKRHKLVKGRELKPPCNDKCKLRCFEKFTEEERQIMFNCYWKLGELQRQRDFIAGCLEKISPKYRYAKEGSSRELNNAFHFVKKGQRIRVCKQFFKNTLDITDRQIRTVVNKQNKILSNIVEEDLRGKHSNHKVVDEAIKNGVRNFIGSLPEIPKKFGQSKSSQQHTIDKTNSKAQIYRDYVNHCKENNEQQASYTIFFKIFHSEFK